MRRSFLFKIIVFTLIILPLSFVNAQINYPGSPLFNPLLDTNYIPIVDVQINNVLQKHKKTESGPRFKDDQFAKTVDLSINTEDFGVWITKPERHKKLWLLRLKSNNAASLNIVFDTFRLIPGAKLFIYNKYQTQIIGALTYKNNKPWGSLATTLIHSDEVYVELQVSTDLDSFGDLSIGKIGVEQSNFLQVKSTKDRWYGSSASCHVNVNCSQNSYIQSQKSAACRIVYLSGKRCSGTLLNNIENNRKPYVLTAAHCFTSDFAANNAVFDFNYESPNCDNSVDTILSVSGASVRAYTENLDFVLLELSSEIPRDYNVIYSGWDARGITPTSSFAIHHPLGDIKKISIDDDPAQDGSFPQFDPNTHWLINDYEVGTSEDGSSGCGLFSQEGYLIGSLTGGGDTCSDVITDYYQKFSHSYSDYYPYKDECLKSWLDPKNTNKLTCRNLDNSEKFRKNADILTNINISDTKEIVQQANDWGYLSGHNYQENPVFAEYYSINGSKYLYGLNIDIAKIHFSSLDQEVTFTIWEGGSVPGKVLYETSILNAEINDMSEFMLDFESTILVHNSFYVGYKIKYQSDTFAVKTVSTSSDLNSAYTYINNAWEVLQLDGYDYPSKLAIEVLVFDYLPNSGVLPDSSAIPSVLIYPNPSKDFFQVYYSQGVYGKVDYVIYDLSGRIVYFEEVINPEPNYQIAHFLPAGVYVLKIMANNSFIESRKLIAL